jgi:hypothetical protein
VTGYNLFYSANNESFGNSVSVGSATTAIISNVPENTTYFFAATAHNAAGLQSPFSTPAAFMGVQGTPDGTFSINPLPAGYSSDALNFSLDSTAPPGATINPVTGKVTWVPGRSFASTTNYFNVNVTDANNPAMNLTEAVVVRVSDYLQFLMGSTAVSSGGVTKLPLTVAASSSVTNLQIVLNWPGTQLQNPTLTFYSPIVSGSLQHVNGQVIIQLQTAANKPLTGTNLVGVVNFQAATGLPSSIYHIAATTGNAHTAAGASYSNVLVPVGEVVVVGSSPLLRPMTGPGGARTLGVYGNTGTYQLQYTTSLSNPVWTTVATYAQTNLMQTIGAGSTNPCIYYRLHQL